MGSQEFELLAPAGSFQTFQAVIEAGATRIGTSSGIKIVS